MSDAKHTPGPWRFATADDGYCYIIGADDTVVCQLAMSGQLFHDVRLIVAATDLLASCEHMSRLLAFGVEGHPVEVALAKADAAIKKARGEP